MVLVLPSYQHDPLQLDTPCEPAVRGMSLHCGSTPVVMVVVVVVGVVSQQDLRDVEE